MYINKNYYEVYILMKKFNDNFINIYIYLIEIYFDIYIIKFFKF